MAWRNIPRVRKGLYTQSQNNKMLSEEEHRKWWLYRIRPDSSWMLNIVQLISPGQQTRRIGWVNFSGLDTWCPEIGLGIGEPELHGRGVGTKMLEVAMCRLQNMGYEYARTTILVTNEASRHIFSKAGFECVCSARPGELFYMWRKEDQDG
jgi:RimJ/RimL family protein N-acetyltransferase